MRIRSAKDRRDVTSPPGRAMSVLDAFIYNFLAMGVIFPWIYVWGPSSFPGGSLEIGIWLTFAAQLPISLAYCFLATVMPFSGGDYIYQTRAFGKWGFISVMSGFVFWILQWIALSGWLFAKLGVAPLLLCLGVFMDQPILSFLALWIQSSWGVFITSVLLTFGTVLFLVRGGLKLYVRVQKLLFILTVVSIGTIIMVFGFANFTENLNDFARTLIIQLDKPAFNIFKADFVQRLMTDVRNSGLNITPTFSWFATLGIVPIAWTSLYAAAWSVQQNDEIEKSNRFGVQFCIIVLSSLVVTLGLFAIAYFEQRAATRAFMTAASAAYWQERGSPETVDLVQNVLQPFPNVLAMAISRSSLISVVIALGFLANAFQVTCNCFIGITRTLIAMSDDDVLPRSLGLKQGETKDKRLARAHWLYFCATIPWIICFNFVPGWENYSLGVTFALGYVYTFSALAATRITASRIKALWRKSNIGHYPQLLIKASGYLGFTLGVMMVVAYFWFPQLGLTGDAVYLMVLSIILISYIIYAWAESTFDSVDERIRQLPVTIEELQNEPSDK